MITQLVFLREIAQLPFLNHLHFVKMAPVIVAHGGAGNVSAQRAEEKNECMKAAIRAGYDELKRLKGCKDKDGVSVAIRVATRVVEELEKDEACNAGYGSVVNEKGVVEMDACVVDGKDLRYGGVASLSGFMHPIRISLEVLSKAKACLLAGNGARNFALDHGFKEVPNNDLISPNVAKSFEEWKKKEEHQVDSNEVGGTGTVGCVVLDWDGNVAAATSTGGLLGKEEGRVGDSPILGMGTFADNKTGAVSATGIGEAIMRYMVAERIANLLPGGDHNEAILKVLNEMKDKVGGEGGAITVSTNGEVGIEFNSLRMSWGLLKVTGTEANAFHVGCSRGENIKVKL